jgi:hypothetical protein
MQQILFVVFTAAYPVDNSDYLIGVTVTELKTPNRNMELYKGLLDPL